MEQQDNGGSAKMSKQWICGLAVVEELVSHLE